jgi:hypothetical protein
MNSQKNHTVNRSQCSVSDAKKQLYTPVYGGYLVPYYRNLPHFSAHLHLPTGIISKIAFKFIDFYFRYNMEAEIFFSLFF